MNNIKKNNSLVRHLVAANQQQFTGRVDIQTARSQSWRLYFCVGRLICANGGMHPVRQLRRHLARHCPKLNFNTLTVRHTDRFCSWSYQMLWLLEQRKYIAPETVGAIVEDMVAEVLFDLLQQEARSPLTYDYHGQDTLQMLRMQLCTMNLKSTVQKARHAWQNWLETGLGDRSPNLAPVLKNHRAIQEQISPRAYQNLAQRINGSRTLRELASAMEQDESKVARSLANYIQKGWIDLVEIGDIDRPIPKVEPVETTAPPVPRQKRQKRDRVPLVACVDDSPQTCELMREIVEGAGYRFVAVTDSVQVLPVLLERKPDLIFLDLIMPVANGYEICSQLRRVEQFAQTPITILTSKDGVVDRMRAKMVKASNFLSKPIESEKVLAIVRKYLGDLNAPAPEHSSKPQTKPAISSPPQPMASGTSFANSIASSA